MGTLITVPDRNLRKVLLFLVVLLTSLNVSTSVELDFNFDDLIEVGKSFTSEPSFSPSAQPTLSHSPTISPTSRPSGSPSSQPSSQPSFHPTTSPSVFPSESPTNQPSIPPTSHPTHAPSLLPSLRPTSTHSDLPSSQPSSIPSMAPSSYSPSKDDDPLLANRPSTYDGNNAGSSMLGRNQLIMIVGCSVGGLVLVASALLLARSKKRKMDEYKISNIRKEFQIPNDADMDVDLAAEIGNDLEYGRRGLAPEGQVRESSRTMKRNNESSIIPRQISLERNQIKRCMNDEFEDNVNFRVTAHNDEDRFQDHVQYVDIPLDQDHHGYDMEEDRFDDHADCASEWDPSTIATEKKHRQHVPIMHDHNYHHPLNNVKIDIAKSYDDRSCDSIWAAEVKGDCESPWNQRLRPAPSYDNHPKINRNGNGGDIDDAALSEFILPSVFDPSTIRSEGTFGQRDTNGIPQTREVEHNVGGNNDDSGDGNGESDATPIPDQIFCIEEKDGK